MRPLIHMQRPVRTIVNMAAVAVLVLLSVACEPETERQETIRITYWTRSWWGDPAQYQDPNAAPIPVAQWQRQQIDAFEAKHPGIKINLQIDPGGREDKIRLAFAGRIAPDVFHGAPSAEFITWAALGFLEAIDPYLTESDRQDIYPGSLETCAYDGKHYGWPLYNHAVGVVINRDLFRERGLADRIPGPQADWTFEEFESLAKKLTFDRDADGRTDAYGVGLHCLDTNHIFLTVYLINFGAQVFDAQGNFVLDSPEGIAGLQLLRRMIDQRIATPGAAGYKYDDMRNLFKDQRIAMYISSAGILLWVEDQVRQGNLEPFDWAFVPLPSTTGVEPTSYLTVGTVFVSRQADPVKRAACMTFARFLTGPQPNRYFWNLSSPRRSSAPPTNANMAAMMQQIDRSNNFMLPPNRLPDRFSMTEEMVRLYQDVLSQPPKASPTEALRSMSERINGKIQRWYRSRIE